MYFKNIFVVLLIAVCVIKNNSMSHPLNQIDNCINSEEEINKYIRNYWHVLIPKTLEEKKLLCHVVLDQIETYTPPLNYKFHWSWIFHVFRLKDSDMVKIFKLFYHHTNLSLLDLFPVHPISSRLIIMLYNEQVINIFNVYQFLNSAVQNYYRPNKFDWLDFIGARTYYDFIIEKNMYFMKQNNKYISAKQNIFEILIITEHFLKNKNFIPSRTLVSYIIHVGLIHAESQKDYKTVHKSNIVLRKLSNNHKYFPEKMCKFDRWLPKNNQVTITCLAVANQFFKKSG